MSTTVLRCFALISIALLAAECSDYDMCLKHCTEDNHRKPVWFDDDHVHARPRKFHFSNRLSELDCLHGICEDVADYPPEEVIDRAVQHNRALTTYFGTVVAPHVNVSIATRYGEEDQQNVCTSKKYTRWPKQMRNIDGNVRRIINTSSYQQNVIYEACTNASAPCWCDKCNLPRTYYMNCAQHYVNIRLAAVDDRGKTTFESFRIPHGCVCEYGRKEYQVDADD